jgi:hypothetical protein
MGLRGRAGAGRLLPWSVAFGTGIAVYFTADREPVLWGTAVPAALLCALLDDRRGSGGNDGPRALADECARVWNLDELRQPGDRAGQDRIGERARDRPDQQFAIGTNRM